jgi:hypothetical protein
MKAKTIEANRWKLRSPLVHALQLRWEQGTWVYGEPSLGVFGEPFVLGADKTAAQLRKPITWFLAGSAQALTARVSKYEVASSREADGHSSG